MSWNDVGQYLKANAATGVGLVGSILTGNIPAAVGLGVQLVASATGSTDPTQALATLQSDPATMVKLKELAVQEDANIRAHIQKMAEISVVDEQKEHAETQSTVRAGDASTDKIVKWTRPLQSWCSLIFAGIYAYKAVAPTEFVFIGFMTLPFTYFGLRQFGKWKDSSSQVTAIIGNKK